MTRLTRTLAALGIVGAAVCPPLRAEPAIAVRTGFRCSQCHVNRTGGGLRTPFGSLYTQTVLPRSLLRWRDGGNLLPADPDARFTVGADARFQHLSVRPRHGETSSSFEVGEANLYGEARLAPGRLSLVLDQRVGPAGSSARELFALFRMRRANAYVKVGKLLPAYGWRLPDDDAFIRQFSGFSYASPDLGVEYGIEPGRWSLHVGVLNGAGGGSDDNPSKQLTLLALRRFRPLRVGISASNDIADGATTTLAGVLGGASLGRLSLLGEADRVEVSGGGSTKTRVLGFLEADVLISRGLTLKVVHDWMDPDRDVRTDAQTRDSVGLEFIPYPFVQLRWFARLEDGPPQVPGSRDAQVDLELHVFF